MDNQLTLEQARKNYQNAGGTLTSTGAIDFSKPIKVADLNTNPITVPPANPNNPYAGLGSSTVLTPPPTYTPPPVPTVEDKYASDLAGLPQAQSQEQLQAELDKKYQIEEKTKTANALKAQIETNTAEAEAAKLSQEGRLASYGAVSGAQRDIDRQLAIKNLPLTAQYQASLGDLQGAQNSVEKLFTAKLADAKAQYDRAKDLIDSAYSVASAKEKKLLDAKKIEEDRKYETEKSLNTYKQSLVGDLVKSGQANLISQLSGAKTIDEVNNIAGQIKSVSGLDDQYKALQIQKLQKELDSTGSTANAQDLIAYAQDTVSSGKLPSVQELKNAGLSAGMVMQVAKELPKTDGEIVDNNTGIKSGKLSSAQIEGLAALRDLTLKLDQAKSKFGELNTGLIGGVFGNIFPSKARQEYSIIKSEIVDLLSRARSGAALTESEIKTYSDKLPSTFNQTFWLGSGGENLLDGLKKSISDKLNTSLKAQGTSMYGFSNVKLGGKDYTVGQEIEVNGIRGRVNPDGTITKL